MPGITLQPEFEDLVYVDKHPQVGREGGDSTLSRTSSPTQPCTMPTIHRTVRLFLSPRTPMIFPL